MQQARGAVLCRHCPSSSACTVIKDNPVIKDNQDLPNFNDGGARAWETTGELSDWSRKVPVKLNICNKNRFTSTFCLVSGDWGSQ